MWIFGIIAFILLMVYLSNRRFWNVLFWPLFNIPLVEKTEPEIGDLTFEFHYDSQGGSYSYQRIENINTKTKELLLKGESSPDPIREFFWDYKMQAWKRDQGRYNNEETKRQALKKKGWVQS